MKSRFIVFATALSFFLIGAGQAVAQYDDTTTDRGIFSRIDFYEEMPWEWNVNAGATTLGSSQPFLVGSETDFTLATRLMRNFPSGLGLGVHLSWTPITFTADMDNDDLFEDTDINMYLYGAEANYSVAVNQRSFFFIGAGAGVATRHLDFADNELFENVGNDTTGTNGGVTTSTQMQNGQDMNELLQEQLRDDTRHDFYVPLSAGFKWFTRTNRPSWGLRLEVRDNMIFHSEDGDILEAFDENVSTSHNWEFTAGVTYAF